jgi:hypothetical protein
MNLDPEHRAGLISLVKVDFAAMILDNLLCDRKSQSAASGLAVAYKRFKSGALIAGGCPSRYPTRQFASSRQVHSR